MVFQRASSFVIVMLLARVAVAAQPTIQHTPVKGEWIDSTCGFDVNIVQSGTTVDISYTDGAGRFHQIVAAPQMEQQMTNITTGKRISFNIAGPGFFRSNPDGSWVWSGTGNWVWSSHPDTLAPGWFMTSGRFAWSADVEGNGTWTRTGNIEDLCARLR